MVKLNKALTKHAVHRMYTLGLEEADILKIFSLYDTDSLVETLKYYKFVHKKMPTLFFYNKLNYFQGWGQPKSRAKIFKSLLVDSDKLFV